LILRKSSLHLNVEIVKNIKLNFATLELLENGIVRIELLDKQSIGEFESREINNSIGVLSDGKPALIMMIPQPHTVFDHGAREFSSSDEGLHFTIADAMVVTSMAHKILVSFYLKFNKPKKPSKAFDNEVDAMAWLLSLKNPS
jgi:hypothetical protein